MTYHLTLQLHAVRALASPHIEALIRPLLYDPSIQSETLSAVMYSTTIALSLESGDHEEVEYMLRSYLDEYERKYADTESVSERVDLMLSMRRMIAYTIRLFPGLREVINLIVENEYAQHLGVRPRDQDLM
jgi:hypothetical protein